MGSILRTLFLGSKRVRLEAGLISDAVLHRQPDCGLLRRRPGYPVLRMGPNLVAVTVDDLDLAVLNFDHGGPLQHDHPVTGWLVVPEAIGGLVAAGDDSVDADFGGLQESGEELLGELGGQIGEEIGVMTRRLGYI